MNKASEKSLLNFDYVIKFNAKTSLKLLSNFTTFVNYNSRRLAFSDDELAVWTYASANLLGVFVAPAFIKHACSTFKTRRFDLHGATATANDTEGQARYFLIAYALYNITTLFENQYGIKFGEDQFLGSVSFGFKDLKKMRTYKRSPLKYMSLRVGCTASFYFKERFIKDTQEHVSQLIYYSYFLNQHLVTEKNG